LTTLDAAAVIDTKARYWLKIAIFAPVMGFPSEYCHKVWYGNKLEWGGWLPDVKKNFEDMFIHFKRIHERDGWTDGWSDVQTLHDSIGRAYA